MNDKAARITFFVEGLGVPATRFRILQYVPFLRAAGHVVHICATRPTKYLWYPQWIRRAPFFKPLIAAPLLLWIITLRIAQILRFAWISDVVVIQRDLLHRDPFGLLERLVVSLVPPRCRIVFDIDDALFSSPDGVRNRAQERKYQSLIPNCDLVLAGNPFLERFFLQFAPSRVIPTVIDTARFVPNPAPDRGQLTIGWTGVSSNLRYLSPILPALRQLQRDHLIKLLLISDSEPANLQGFEDVPIEWLRWSEQDEVQQLHRIDIGIMPLTDSEWTRGKCGFKILQYMAVGIPAIASPVGVNTQIIEHGVSGLLADTDIQWLECLTTLCADPVLRDKIGRNARVRVCERYSVEAWHDTFTRCVIGSPSKA